MEEQFKLIAESIEKEIAKQYELLKASLSEEDYLTVKKHLTDMQNRAMNGTVNPLDEVEKLKEVFMNLNEFKKF